MPTTPAAVPMLLYLYPWHTAFRPLCSNLCLPCQAAEGVDACVASLQAFKKNHLGNAKVQICADLLLSGRVRVGLCYGLPWVGLGLGLWSVVLQFNGDG